MKEIENQAIEEIAKVIEGTEKVALESVGVRPSPTMYAKDLYWHGYRKQSEGEWKKAYDKAPRYVCTACNHLYNNKGYKFCPNCGSKMKGGAE